jgi:hypothetical protein
MILILVILKNQNNKYYEFYSQLKNVGTNINDINRYKEIQIGKVLQENQNMFQCFIFFNVLYLNITNNLV